MTIGELSLKVALTNRLPCYHRKRSKAAMQKEPGTRNLRRLNQSFAAGQISRCSFLRGATLTALSATRAFAVIEAVTWNAIAKAQVANTRWSDAAREQLKRMQETAYAGLGKRLGLGDEPLAVYQSLRVGRMPEEYISLQKFNETFGPTLGKAKGWGNQEQVIQDYLKKYHKVELPTPYEDPNFYGMLLWNADRIEEAAKSLHLPVPRHVLFGTVPTADVRARSSLVPRTREYIVVFQYGLFMFLYKMAWLAASVLPPLVPDEDQLKFTTEPDPVLVLKRHPEILKQFNTILYGFLVGDPRLAPTAASPDKSQAVAAMTLLQGMELFVLAHEYKHVIYGDLERDRDFQGSQEDRVRQSWKAEYDADEIGLALAVGVSPKYTSCAIDYFFSCMKKLEDCLTILTNSQIGSDKHSDHPPLVTRREQLRRLLRELRPGEETESSIRLAVQLEAFLDSLWNQSLVDWIAMYKKGVRPSPIWL